jgi:excisionase family DNA binding protein
MLTIAEVADRLRVSRSAVRDYYRRDGLPIVRLSHRTLRVREEDLDRWLESRVENGAQAPSTRSRAASTGASVSRLPRMASDDDDRSGSTARRRPPAANSSKSSAASLVDFQRKSPA